MMIGGQKYECLWGKKMQEKNSPLRHTMVPQLLPPFDPSAPPVRWFFRWRLQAVFYFVQELFLALSLPPQQRTDADWRG